MQSGFPCDRFCFEGFLPQKKGRAKRLEELRDQTRTMIFYESPFRVVKCLEQFAQTFGGDRQASVSRELTKKFEQTVRGTLDELIAYFTENEPRGEYVLVIEGRSREEMIREQQAGWESMSIEEHMQHYESQGINRKEAMKLVAKDRGVSKRDIYQALL